MSQRVYVKGLEDGVAKEDVEDLFRPFGKLEDVWIARKPSGFGFIQFEDPKDAEVHAREA